MSEVWAAAIAAGGALISASQEQKNAEDARADAKVATRKETQYSAALSAFNREQDDYYNQLDRSRKSRGLDEFKKFNTVQDYAPSYSNENGGVVMPDKKADINTIMKDMGIEEEKSAKAKRSLMDKLGNPLGF